MSLCSVGWRGPSAGERHPLHAVAPEGGISACQALLQPYRFTHRALYRRPYGSIERMRLDDVARLPGSGDSYA